MMHDERADGQQGSRRGDEPILIAPRLRRFHGRWVYVCLLTFSDGEYRQFQARLNGSHAMT